MDETPFVSGARVAINVRYSDDMREGFVDKVYKTGRFTLRGSNQQWRPWKVGCPSTWHATETGDGYTKTSLQIWDESTDAKISARIVETRLKTRWHEVRHKINHMTRNPGQEVIALFESALAKVQQ